MTKYICENIYIDVKEGDVHKHAKDHGKTASVFCRDFGYNEPEKIIG